MLGLSLDIARRYLYGKKSTNSINIITGISIFGISIGTAALILILSVFNGFEGLLSGLFNSFNPDLKVIPKEGKYLESNFENLQDVLQLTDVLYASQTIEEVALFEYKGSKEIGRIKGVDEQYLKVTNLDSLIVNGHFLLNENNINYAIIGTGMRGKLGVNLADKLSTVTLYMPQRKKKIIGAKEFITREVYPSGIFSVKSDTDYQYIITNLKLVQSILDRNNLISALEIKISENANIEELKSQIQKIYGNDVIIRNRYEQDESYLKVINMEKWFTFLIVGLTILLIAFNLIGALWMIVLDKKKDIAVLKVMGYRHFDINQLFLSLGILITAIGIALGFIIALGVYFLQKEFGLVGIPQGFLIDSYPVKLKLSDFLIVTLSVLIIGVLVSIIPALKASSVDVNLKSVN